MTSAMQGNISGDYTLPQMLRHWMQKTPNRTALHDKDLGIWNPITWQQYWDNVGDLACGLDALGFGEGDRLAIASDNTPEWFYADLAAQAVGGVCVGIYPTNPWPEIQYILNHSGVTVVVCGDQEQVDKVLDAAASEGGLPTLKHIFCVDMKGMHRYDTTQVKSLESLAEVGRARPDRKTWFEQKVAAGKPDDVSALVYTSGTTGAPKGAMLTHKNFVTSTTCIVNEFGFSAENHSVVCYLPLCHVAERTYSQVSHLICGSVVSFAESVDAVQANLREIAPRVFFGVPRIWEKMQQTMHIKLKESSAFQRSIVGWAMRKCGAVVDAQSNGKKPSFTDKLLLKVCRWTVFLPVLRFFGLDRAFACFAGGASVSPDVVRFFRILGIPIFQIYGLTETAAFAFVQNANHIKSGHTGLPLKAIEYRIADDGELLLKGNAIFKGYFNDDAATKDTFRDGWLLTGDIVKQDESGEIAIVDRKKEIIITSGGKNIAPSEMENALKESFYIREAIIIGDGRHFVSALIQVDLDSVGKWAQEHGLAFTTYKSLVQLPEVISLIDKEVNTANKRFARVEQVRKFVLLDKELDHDDGELTATMKVRRSAIEKLFAEEINRIYQGSE